MAQPQRPPRRPHQHSRASSSISFSATSPTAACSSSRLLAPARPRRRACSCACSLSWSNSNLSFFRSRSLSIFALESGATRQQRERPRIVCRRCRAGSVMGRNSCSSGRTPERCRATGTRPARRSRRYSCRASGTAARPGHDQSVVSRATTVHGAACLVAVHHLDRSSAGGGSRAGYRCAPPRSAFERARVGSADEGG